jgi:hypothetical protein
VRRSYKTIARSVAHVARIDVSVWLKVTWLIVSIAEGQTRVCTGAPDVRVVSYIETVLEATANEGSVRWCETDVKGALPCQVAFGAVFEACAYGSNSCTCRSAPHVINCLFLVQHMPLTRFSCACACHFSSLLVKSHTFTTPSPLPLAKCSSEFGSLAKEYTPSTWPGSKSPTKGFANMRSILVAFSARVYSRARSKGCCLGSRLRVTFATLEPGACAAEADRLRALIFMLDGCVVRYAGVANFCRHQKFERQVGLANHAPGASAVSARRGSLHLFAVGRPRTWAQFLV